MKSLLLSLLGVAMVSGAALASDPLALDPIGTRSLRLGYMPIRIALSDKKPANVSKEPIYSAAPKYGAIHVGNGPHSAISIALDEPTGGDWKIYVDANGNGDLTDDGDGAWKAKKLDQARKMYGVHQIGVRASWGDSNMEYASGEYGLAFYRFVGTDFLLMYREAARTGQVTAGGKSYRAVLVENDADALYNKKLTSEGAPIGAKSGPVWLQLTPAGGKTVMVDARAPFALDGKTFEAGITPDGGRITLRPTTKAAYVPTTRESAPSKPLLASGTAAPNFTCFTLDGKPVQLSDLKGKVVVMDFWATWCGPCMVTMPHLEKTWQKIKDRTDVTVIGVCVWDEKDAYTKWVPQNKDKFTFPLLFDPAGRGDKSIAGSLYNVSGIPTTYVIDKDGKVFASLVGSGDIPAKLGGELKKLGIDAE